MKSFDKCSICHQWAFLAGHKCPPRWQVRYQDDPPDDGYDPWKDIRADTAEEAAKLFIVRDDDAAMEGSYHAVVVRGDEPGAKELAFGVSIDLEPVYSAVALG